MRIVAISDTHCQLNKIKLPKADVLLIAGDATYRGNLQELSEFNEHLGEIKHKYKSILFTPGNHDGMFQTDEKQARDIVTNAIVLIDEEIVIDGYKFYGSPWQIFFNNWYFNLPAGEALRKKWELIPNDVDVLLTHSPPYGILDKCPDGHLAGCMDLYKRVWELTKFSHHIYGHIHLSYGKKKIGKVTFINASSCTESYQPTNPPFVFTLKDKK